MEKKTLYIGMALGFFILIGVIYVIAVAGKGNNMGTKTYLGGLLQIQAGEGDVTPISDTSTELNINKDKTIECNINRTQKEICDKEGKCTYEWTDKIGDFGYVYSNGVCQKFTDLIKIDKDFNILYAGKRVKVNISIATDKGDLSIDSISKSSAVKIERIVSYGNNHYEFAFNISGLSDLTATTTTLKNITIEYLYENYSLKDIIMKDNIVYLPEDVYIDNSFVGEGLDVSTKDSKIYISGIDTLKDSIFIDPTIGIANISASEDIDISTVGTPKSFQVLIKFPITSIPAGATITDASLGLWATSASSIANSIHAQNCSNITWTETNVNNFGMESSCKGAATKNESTIAVGWNTWDRTEAVKSAYANSKSFVTTLLNFTNTAVSYSAVSNDNTLRIQQLLVDSVTFNSSEAIGTGTCLGTNCVPYLAVTYSATNTAPTQGTPILNATDMGANLISASNVPDANLTCWNQSVADADGNTVTTMFNWWNNSRSLMIGYWSFDTDEIYNNGNIKDYSGNGKTLTIHWTPETVTWKSGLWGGYYYLTGVPTSNAGLNISGGGYHLSGAFTITAWINLTDVVPGARTLVGNSSGTANMAQKIVMRESNHLWDIRITDGVVNGLETNISWSNKTNPHSNNWVFMAVTRNGTNSIMWSLNGGAWIYNTTALSSGANPYDASGTFDFDMIGNNRDRQNLNGSIDEVRIYNFSLPISQVQALYQNKTWQITNDSLVLNDNWTCEVTPNDGYTDGIKANSTDTTISQCTCIPFIGKDWVIDDLECTLGSSCDMAGGKLQVKDSGYLKIMSTAGKLYCAGHWFEASPSRYRFYKQAGSVFDC